MELPIIDNTDAYIDVCKKAGLPINKLPKKGDKLDLAYEIAMNRIAYGLGVAQIISAGFDVWLYNNASVDGYLVIRFFVNWPFTTAVIILSMLYLGKKLSVIPGFTGITNAFESRLESDKKSSK